MKKHITVEDQDKKPMLVNIGNSPNANTPWFTRDNCSEVGEQVVIENLIGARVSAKRIK